ncbi:hypothetical protein BOX15_Mlig015166g1, partial [Macrostomum lignano]
PQTASKMPGSPMVFPYTYLAKVRNFPWRAFWNESRMFRFMTYTLPVPIFVLAKIRKALDSEDNRRQWKEIRGRRLINFFDPYAIPPNKIHLDDHH